MATALPSFASFPVDEQSAGVRWKKWVQKFENLICGLDIKSDDRKRALLLHYAGDGVFDIVESFTPEQRGTDATDDDGNPNSYKVLRDSLNAYFTPKQNTSFDVFKFRQAKQHEGEAIDAFSTRLRIMASLCNFQDTDREILAQIIQGCTSTRLRRKALKDDLSLANVLAEARSLELSDARAAEIENVVAPSLMAAASALHTPQHLCGSQHGDSSTAVCALQHKHRLSGGQHGDPRQRSGGSGTRGSSQHQQRGFFQSKRCRYCGGAAPHTTGCPARGKDCRKCGKIGHFARVCESSKSAQKVSCTFHPENLQAPKHDEDEDDTCQCVFSTSRPSEASIRSPEVKASIVDIPFQFVLDSGTTSNIINFQTFQEIKRARPQIQLLSPCPLIYPYGSDSPLPLIGHFSEDIEANGKRERALFYVMKKVQAKNTSNLLSCATSGVLGLIHFTLSTAPHPPIPDQFPSLFDGGMGKLTDISVKLHIDSEARPVAQGHRRIPFHVRKDVEAELKRLEKLDVIEKVDGPTPWVSPIVVVPKKNNGVRVCIDMRIANNAIAREKHPMPTLDDLISDLNGSTVFSKLDLSSAYHQLELAEESRFITTFSTHVGLRRYKRLLFGVNAASEIFQNAISELLSDIPGAKNLSDDIIVHGKTQDEHDEALKSTLKRLDERGAKLRKEKCVFSVPELTFFGHVFNKEGVSPDPEKVKTINESSPPKTVHEVRSFLGMTQYVSRFIPGYATITEPLRNLTKKDSPWRWGANEQKSFQRLKTALTSSHVMSYFSPQKKTQVLVDASPVGLGAILTQEGRIVCYASRALTETEQRYSQIDREMLAVVFGVEHFHLYLYGAPFSVITDHKPLLGIVGSPKPTTIRIERLRLRLMPYEMNLVYAPGRDELNPADYISRHPTEKPRRDNVSEEYIRYVARNCIPIAMTQTEVQEATKHDTILQRVMTAVQDGRWNDPDLTAFATFRDEISVHDGFVLRGYRLIIPTILRSKVVSIAHQSHQGMVKTKQHIREKVWFPGIDRMVEDAVKSCIPCQASYPGPKQREPLIPTPLPAHPWNSLSVDFAGPFPSGDYALVVIDEFSRFPEVEIVSSTSAAAVIPKLETIFARQGFPKTVKSDNGPPFQGHEFADFAKRCGFEHRKTTPLWPEANGEAERFMRTLNRHVRASEAENRNWKSSMPTFLMMYRATPHTSTGVSPFEALNGRKMTTALPEITLPQNPGHSPVKSRIIQNDARSKAKMAQYTDSRRHTKPSNLSVGDDVLVKQPKINKLTPPYNPKPFTITKRFGSQITAQRGSQQIVRNSSFFKRIRNISPNFVDEEEEESDEEDPHQEPDVPLSPPQVVKTNDQDLGIQPPTPSRRSQPSTPTPRCHPAPAPGQQDAPPGRPTRQRRPPTYLSEYDTSGFV